MRKISRFIKDEHFCPKDIRLQAGTSVSHLPAVHIRALVLLAVSPCTFDQGRTVPMEMMQVSVRGVCGNVTHSARQLFTFLLRCCSLVALQVVKQRTTEDVRTLTSIRVTNADIADFVHITNAFIYVPDFINEPYPLECDLLR